MSVTFSQISWSKCERIHLSHPSKQPSSQNGRSLVKVRAMKMPLSLRLACAGRMARPTYRGRRVGWLWELESCECLAQRTRARRYCGGLHAGDEMSRDKSHDRWDFDSVNCVESHGAWDLCNTAESACGMSGRESHDGWDLVRMGEAESHDAWDGDFFRRESSGESECCRRSTARLAWMGGHFKRVTMHSR